MDMSKLSIYFIKLFNVDNTQIITVVHLTCDIYMTSLG